MTRDEIAMMLVEGCRTGGETANLDKIYAQDAVSVEAADMSGAGRETHGLEGIKGKHAWWDSAFDVLEGQISDPFPHGDDEFAVIFEMKTKSKETGEVSDMKEVAIYTVADGKIVREAFYYPTGG